MQTALVLEHPSCFHNAPGHRHTRPGVNRRYLVTVLESIKSDTAAPMGVVTPRRNTDFDRSLVLDERTACLRNRSNWNILTRGALNTTRRAARSGHPFADVFAG